MSEHIFKFCVSDLERVRIVCVACGVATEMTTKQLAGQNGYRCQCSATIGSNAAFALGSAIEVLKAAKDFKVEFAIPIKG